ncbi:hypothetical protein INT45_012587, partial [Circinella minor]
MFLRLLILLLFIGIFLHPSFSSLATPIDENDYLPIQPSSTTPSIIKNPLFYINNTFTSDDDDTTTTLFIHNKDDQEEESLIASLLMIGISEIGDKTFLIAAIMAMKHSRWAVFIGSFSALSIMAIVSTLLGRVVPNFIPKSYTNMIAAILFFIFGLRMAWEAYHMKQQHQQQQPDNNNGVVIDIDNNNNNSENKMEEYNNLISQEEEEGEEGEEIRQQKQQRKQQPVLIEAFILTFLGEWGDKSQISTIALAASNNVLWVAIGVIIGHAICTALAVLGGRLIADRISVRT